MADHNLLGKTGEKIARDFLIKKGYRIVESNWRHGRAEIDIIARQEDILVFVEVKTRSKDDFGQPEEAVTAKKEALLIKAGRAYMRLVRHEWAFRFDIISIIAHQNTAANIRHFENVFFSAY